MSANSQCSNLSYQASSADIAGCVFGYLPNQGAAGLFIGLFSILAVVHLALAIRSRSLIGLGISFCCVAEVTGFAIRIAVVHSWSTSAFIAMTVFLIVSPSFLALVNYFLLSDITKMASGIDPSAPSSSPTIRGFGLLVLLEPFLPDGRINPDFVSRLLVVLAMVAVILQITGITDLTSSSASQSTVDEGQHLLIAGLAVQLFTYTCWMLIVVFLWLSPRYQFRVAERPAMRRLLSAMIGVIALLAMRGIYRLIEYAAGSDSSIATTEAPYYTCDALFVASALVLFAVLDVGRSAKMAEEEFRESQKSTTTTSGQQQQMATRVGGEAV